MLKSILSNWQNRESNINERKNEFGAKGERLS
jgi:hypothetical protein